MSVKKLGFGTMRLPKVNPDDNTSIEIRQVCDMMDLFLEKGYTYVDTAWMYHKFASECAVKWALVKRHPRDSFTLATKLHESYVEGDVTKDDIFAKQCEKCGVDFFDYYLLHAINDKNIENYEAKDCFNWLKGLKEAGKIKHAGFSFHGTAPVLDQILTKYPWIEFVQLQLNYLDWDNEKVQSGANYATCEKHGVPVVVMEPVKGGSLANLPTRDEKLMKAYNPGASIASWAIRFAATLPNVMMVLSGMSNLEQMQDNINTYDNLQPLNDEEKAIIAKIVDDLNKGGKIPCTGCAYCKEGCPMQINIPEYFKLYNGARDDVDGQKEEYDRLTLEFGKASACIECGQCEGICPQSLPIIDDLKDVAKFFEK